MAKNNLINIKATPKGKNAITLLPLLLLIFVILATLLSMGQNIWFDEGYSIFVAKQPVKELIALVAVDAHPPLYYLILKLWGSIFQWNEIALRALSILFSTVALAFSFLLVKTLSSTKIAIRVMPFMVLAPFVLRYSYEIRPYALTSALVVIGTFLLLIALKKGKPWQWALYGLVVALGMLTLYMSALVWLGHAILLGYLSWRNKNSPPIKTWLSSYIFAIFLFLPWLPTFIKQYTNSALPGIGQPINLATASETTSHLLFYRHASNTTPLQLILFLGLSSLIIYLLIQLITLKNKKERFNLLFLGAVTVTPFFAVTILNAVGSEPFYISRYLAHFAIFYYLSVGYIIIRSYKLKPVVSLTAYVLMMVILCMGVYNLAKIGNYNFERAQTPNIKPVAKKINCRPGTVVVAQDEYTYIDSIYYLEKTGCTVKFFQPEDVSTRGGYAPLHGSREQVRAIKGIKANTIYYVTWKNNDSGTIFTQNGYKLIRSYMLDKNVVEEYKRISAE